MVDRGAEEADPEGAAKARASLLGRVLLERYRIDSYLAHGAMGDVYRGTHLGMIRRIAVKILRIDAKTQPRFVKRFRREAAILARLTDPHIVTVYDYGETDDGLLFLVMEYVQGRALCDVIAEEAPIAPLRAVSIAMQVAQGLRRAHRAGVVHRDLKPANIMHGRSEDGQDCIKVLDFGVAKFFNATNVAKGLAHADEVLTRAGFMLGTPAFVAPEQALGDPVDARTDIYALGVTMYLMVSGQLPFEANNVRELLTLQVKGAVPPIGEGRPNVSCPPELEAVICRCLEKRPDDRFSDAQAVLHRLKEVHQGLRSLPTRQQHLATAAYPNARREEVASEDIPPSTRSKQGRWPAAVWIGVLLAVGLGWFLLGELRPSPNPMAVRAKTPVEKASAQGLRAKPSVRPKDYKSNPY